MILSRQHRAVYYCVAKTGSRSVSETLCARMGFVQLGEYHDRRRLKRAAKWFHFATVRNPFARAASLYFYCLGKKTNRMHSLARGTDLNGFCVALANDPKIQSTQAEFLRGVELSAILRTESLAEDFGRLPFVPEGCALPHQNRGNYIARWTEQGLDAVRHWAREDFAVFGYSEQFNVKGVAA